MHKLSLLFIAVLMNQLVYSQPFISEINNFEKQDSLAMPAKEQILLVGSSTFRFWVTSKTDLREYPTINRGFGGSQMSDVNYYFDKIVLKYEPKLILVYAGDNDLAAGESPETILEDFKVFAQKVKLQLPRTTVGYCSIRPSMARTNIRDKQVYTNTLIRDYCMKLEGFHFVNIYQDYFLSNGELMPDVFVQDKLHLNEKGYAIWTDATLKFLKNHYKP